MTVRWLWMACSSEGWLDTRCLHPWGQCQALRQEDLNVYRGDPQRLGSQWKWREVGRPGLRSEGDCAMEGAKNPSKAEYISGWSLSNLIPNRVHLEVGIRMRWQWNSFKLAKSNLSVLQDKCGFPDFCDFFLACTTANPLNIAEVFVFGQGSYLIPG
jgi:hypothetical protein